MRCNICDQLLSEPNYNKDLGAYEPCDTCLAVISDTLNGFKDRVTVDEDELGDDRLDFLEDHDTFFDPDDDFT